MQAFPRNGKLTDRERKFRRARGDIGVFRPALVCRLCEFMRPLMRATFAQKNQIPYGLLGGTVTCIPCRYDDVGRSR